ncbi:radical SAM protein [Streptomyces sp. MRC013]|uniref:radical SAM protein n=1 Tax=Streptomyces sp. MRC013 TaxID=2898276 RepID=UPI002026074E|nr:radical SAM protein [Streptomyces sp. MRC013]URM88973.1 radical SAM protein [Streptomyces sp. MRC013]
MNLVVFKVVQRCNLDCSYCYVYNRGDDSWRTRPTYVSEKVVRALGRRIAEHCGRHALKGFTVELHGGEPLLLGKDRMRRVLDTLRSECASVSLHFAMQTNGLLLDEEWLDLFGDYGVSFGISLDGPPEIADRYRTKRGGGGSTRELLRTIAGLRKTRGAVFDELFGGCLAVIDPSCDGAGLVDWFVENGFGTFDFLLPDGNRANPPHGWTGSSAPYRRFLIEAFDRWYTLGDRAPRIRTFEQMMMGRMGRKVRLDALGEICGTCASSSRTARSA